MPSGCHVLNLVPTSHGWWHQPGIQVAQPITGSVLAKPEDAGVHQDRVNHPKGAGIGRVCAGGITRHLHPSAGIFTGQNQNDVGMKEEWDSREKQG